MSTYKTSESFFVRWVDDYLFVTTNLQLAQRYLSTMRFNMPHYGSVLNVDKLLINFEVTDQTFGQIHGQRLSWCGFIFNLETMECSYNYIQYIGMNMNYFFNVHQYCVKLDCLYLNLSEQQSTIN